IQENLRTREEQATSTTTFLSEQLALKEKQLEAQEQRLRDFKMQALGELPEQQQGNLAIMYGLQAQLQNTMSKIGATQQQRVYLETLLAAYAHAASAATDAGAAESAAGGLAPPPEPAGALANEIAKLKLQRTILLSQ